MDARRGGKTLVNVEMTKAAQRAGRRVLWVTFDRAATIETLARHGALSVIVDDHLVEPRFRRDESN